MVITIKDSFPVLCQDYLENIAEVEMPGIQFSRLEEPVIDQNSSMHIYLRTASTNKKKHYTDRMDSYPQSFTRTGTLWRRSLDTIPEEESPQD